MSTPPSVLFVCLGNICRSPLAEAAMRAELAVAGRDARVDSAGTGDWHIGRAPDPRAIAEAKRRGHDITGYQARQVTAADFQAFEHVVALDRSNLANLQRLAPADAPARLSLLLDHVPGRAGQDVADPYYGEAAGFAVTWEEVSAGARGLLERYFAPPPTASRPPAPKGEDEVRPFNFSPAGGGGSAQR